MSSKRLHLVRHASSTRESLGVWGRLVDAPLEEGFAAQLSRTRSYLERLHDPEMFSSPLLRCLQTAQFLAPDRSVHVVPELRAYHSGEFENATTAQIEKHHPGYLHRSFRQRFMEPEFGEESIADQVSRVSRGFLELLEVDADDSVVVAHYSSINILAHVSALNWDLDSYADGLYDILEGGYLSVTIDPRAVRSGLASHFGIAKEVS